MIFTIRKGGLLISFFLVLLSFQALAQAPDYSKLSSWASHISKTSASNIEGSEGTKAVDVFFVYPTIYSNEPIESYSANVFDSALNQEIQSSSIYHQASVFSSEAIVFAPYYRQMHIQGYHTKNDSTGRLAKAAFETAYDDVKRAFYHYIEFENKGRPFVIASHSQGTNHTERLLKQEILPNTSFKKLLVMAYLVGMPIKDDFKDFEPCSTPDQTGCFVTWRTYGSHFEPETKGDSIVCTNPISFSSEQPSTVRKEHAGIRFQNGKVKAKRAITTQLNDGFLQIELKKWPLKKGFTWDDYHIADYNIFWPNIQENFKVRVDSYYKKNSFESVNESR